MRRFFLVLCVCLLTVVLLLTTLSARAGSDIFNPTQKQDEFIPVYADIQNGSETPAPVVYGVTLNWGTMAFQYTPTATMTWDPIDHQYVTDSSGGTWECADGANRISITNDSNAQIQYRVTYENVQAFTGITGTVTARPQTGGTEPVVFNGNGRTLIDRASAASNEACTDYVFLTLSGTLPENVVENNDGDLVKVGDLTVTIMTNQS